MSTGTTQYGPRIAAAVYLSDGQFIPEDLLQETLHDLFGLAPSMATLADINRKVAEKLTPFIESVGLDAPDAHNHPAARHKSGPTSV